MIKTCQHCGAVNGEPAEVCCICDAPLAPKARAAVSRQVATPTEGNLAVQPEWRSEVKSRLRAYRVRRNGSEITDLQPELPFEHPSEAVVESANAAGSSIAPPLVRQSPRSRKLSPERFEISIPLNESSSVSGRAGHPGFGQANVGSAHDDIFPVAALSDRRRAALLDAALLLFSYGGMLALFTVLGGRLGFNKLDLVVAGATLVLFYAQYFALFTIFGGSTPGMMVCGLRVVSFDGGVATSRQMSWRSFGYLISAGTCFLGFLWAIWDEDHLCWHDRISQTYITPVEAFGATKPSSTASSR